MLRLGITPRWLPRVLGLGAVILLAASPLPAQDDEFVPAEEEAIETTADFEAIDDLLALDEEVLTDPGTYSYDPEGRRDPFRSLLAPRARVAPEEQKRPEGVAGLLIDEIELQGIFILQDGPVAQVQSSAQETSFLLRPGDQLWDGDVVSIDLEEVVFKQSVNDPTALKPFRDVTKRLD